jgi:hypothetical protein
MNISKIVAAICKGATSGTKTSAELRADLGRIDLASLGAEVARIEAERRALLLTGSDGQLEANGRELASAKLAVERASAAIDELTKLAAEAVEREHAAELEAAYVKVQQDAGKLAEEHATIEDFAAKIADHLREAAQLSAALHRWNARAEKKAPDRRVSFTPIESVRLRVINALK